MASKRLLVVIHRPYETRSPGIKKQDLIFFWGRRTKLGWVQKGWSEENRVTVTFQSDEQNEHYAPKVSFSPSESNAKLSLRVSKAWKRWDQSFAEFLSAVNAKVVYMTDDRTPGGSSIYKEGAVPTAHPLEALAYG